jgi:hypothetical protein
MYITSKIEKMGAHGGIFVKVYWKFSAVEGEVQKVEYLEVTIDETLPEEFIVEFGDIATSSGYEKIYLWTVPNMEEIHTSLINQLIEDLYNS